MVENVTSTGIDALLKYVNEHGDTDVLNLSKVFKVDVTVIEQWANILENAHMVKVSYKLDKMFIAPLSMSTEDIKAMSAETDVRRKAIVSDVRSREIELNQIEEKINQFSKFTEDAEKIFKVNAGSVKKTLDELHALKNKANEEYDGVKKSKDYLDSLSEKMEKEMASVRGKVEGIKKIDAGAENAQKFIDDMKSKIKLMEADRSDMQKKFDASIAAYKKEMGTLASSIDSEVKSLKDMVARQEKLVRDNIHAASNYEKEIDRLVKDLDRREKVTRDRVNKARSDIDSVYDLAGQKTKIIVNEVDNYINKFGGLASIDNSIRSIKEGLEKAKKDCEYCRQQFVLINTELREIEANPKLSLEEKNQRVKSVNDKVEDIDSKIVQIGKDVEGSNPENLEPKS